MGGAESAGARRCVYEMHGEKAERGGTPGHGERASELARKARREKTLDDRAGRVYEQRPEKEVPLSKHSLVVLVPKQLAVR